MWIIGAVLTGLGITLAGQVVAGHLPAPLGVIAGTMITLGLVITYYEIKDKD